MTQALVEPLLDASLDPLFWENLRASTPSAWHGHVPFAHWIVPQLRPRVLVELGTHAGVSYAAFCQAVQRSGLETRCFAVDSWAGDDHAGAYSEEVYDELKAFHDARFAGFSRMLRTTFDAALADFADGSVDLLHIDGFHSYEAVSHDFHSWRPKLSDRAVVLFHDTNVRERGFGVWRFWDEIKDSGVGSVAFLHAFGLGVLLMGPQAPDSLRAICAAPVERLRSRFEALGRLQILEYERAQAPAVLPNEVTPPPPPVVDASLPAPEMFIAERFTATARLQSLRVPHDAVTRNEAGCTVWVISDDAQDWRQGDLQVVPEGPVVTLVFAPFANTRPRHFHVMVTGPSPAGAGLPQALADQLVHRRAPIALDTSPVDLPAGGAALPAHGLFLFDAGRIVGAPQA